MSVSYWLERLVSERTYNVLMGTLNPTHSLTQPKNRHVSYILEGVYCHQIRNLYDFYFGLMGLNWTARKTERFIPIYVYQHTHCCIIISARWIQLLTANRLFISICHEYLQRIRTCSKLQQLPHNSQHKTASIETARCTVCKSVQRNNFKFQGTVFCTKLRKKEPSYIFLYLQ